jgi:hypothetical protein
MPTNAQIVHEDGTPFTEEELNSSGCPDCDRLSAPELARRAEQAAAEKSAYRAERVVVRKRFPLVSHEEIAAMQDPKRFSEPLQFSINPIPVPCPKHVPRKHPWIEAVQLEDLDDTILQKFVPGPGNPVGWAPYIAGASYFPKGFCYEDREFSQAEVRAEIERRKTQPARVENAMQKYLRLSRIPQFWISDSERKFLQSREAALVALKLRMR